MALNFTDKYPSYHLSCLEWGESFEIVHSTAIRTSYIWTCILNGILAIHSTILNSLIIVLYFKDRRLQTTANVLILALALSDLSVALLAQPAAIVNSALKLSGIHRCVSHLVTFALSEFGIGLSCWTVYFTITFERLLAVCWPLKHRVLVTKSLLRRIYFVQVALCFLIVPIVLNLSLKFVLSFQSGAIIFGTVFMLAVYLCIFVVIRKRSRKMAEHCVTSSVLENVSKNISESSVSQDSKRKYTLSDSVSQDPKREIHLSKNASQSSKRQNKPSNNVSQDSKRKIDSPRNVSQDSKQKQSLPKSESQHSKRNSLEIVSQDSKHTSLEIVSHDSNGSESKLPEEKLKDEQRSFNACAAFQKAMLKLKQELRVCKAMAVVAGALALCFLPRVVIVACAVTGVISMQTYNYLAPWLDVLAYANSSLNPYIYFFHNRDITEGVKRIVFGKNSAQLNKSRMPSQLAKIQTMGV